MLSATGLSYMQVPLMSSGWSRNLSGISPRHVPSKPMRLAPGAMSVSALAAWILCLQQRYRRPARPVLRESSQSKMRGPLHASETHVSISLGSGPHGAHWKHCSITSLYGSPSASIALATVSRSLLLLITSNGSPVTRTETVQSRSWPARKRPDTPVPN